MVLRYVLILLLLLFVARAFWRVVDGLLEGLSGRRTSARRGGGVPMARDPVCGTFVVPDHAVTLHVGSTRVYFCSTVCRDKYRAKTA